MFVNALNFDPTQYLIELFRLILINKLIAYLSCCFKRDDLSAINFGKCRCCFDYLLQFCLSIDATYLSFCLSSIILSCVAFKFRHSIAIRNLAIIEVQHLLSRHGAMYDNSGNLSIEIQIEFQAFCNIFLYEKK